METGIRVLRATGLFTDSAMRGIPCYWTEEGGPFLIQCDACYSYVDLVLDFAGLAPYHGVRVCLFCLECAIHDAKSKPLVDLIEPPQGE